MVSGEKQRAEKNSSRIPNYKSQNPIRISELILHTDGAARGNPGPAGVGGVILDKHGRAVERISEYIGDATNNVAEYTALILTLEQARKYKAKEVKIYSDSELLIQQLDGKYKIKNQSLKPLVSRVRFLLSSYNQVEFFHVPREKNAGADRLANKAIEAYKTGDKSEKKLESVSEQKKLF